MRLKSRLCGGGSSGRGYGREDSAIKEKKANLHSAAGDRLIMLHVQCQITILNTS